MSDHRSTSHNSGHVTGHLSEFSPRSERSPLSVNINTASYRDLDLSGRHVGDQVTFVLKGRITQLGTDFEDSEKLTLEFDVDTIENLSRRSGLDSDGRVT